MGAIVTLLRSDISTGPFAEVADGSSVMSSANRSNPDTTDATGHFGWTYDRLYKCRRRACVDPFHGVLVETPDAFRRRSPTSTSVCRHQAP